MLVECPILPKAPAVYCAKISFAAVPTIVMTKTVLFSISNTNLVFRSLVVGRWVTEEEKRIAGNVIFDALADLSLMLNIPAAALGLREHLNLAFGKGGSAGVQAHYEVPTRTLALAKNAGAGALAHEWWHAFDHYIADKLFVGAEVKKAFASERWLMDEPVKPHPLNHALDEVFSSVLLNRQRDGASDFVERALRLDEIQGSFYYSQPTELLARAFECWIQSRDDIKNQYLVSGTKASELAKEGGYPTAEELATIAQAMHTYFQALGHALSS